LRYPGDVTDGVVSALRGNLGFGSLIKSYADAVKSRDQVVVDYFNVRDLGQTLGLILVNIKFFIDKSVSYIKRRLRKHEIVRKV
jgi:hypothetical protein